MNALLALSTVGLLIAAGAAPLAFAHHEDERPAEREPMARPESARPSERPHESYARPFINDSRPHGPLFGITIEGTAVDQDNQSYTIDAEGVGIARPRVVNGSLAALYGFARVNASLVDDNGSVVKEGVLHLRLLARQDGEGNWTWIIISVGHTDLGAPRVYLRGDGTVENGTASLDGTGFAMTRSEEHGLLMLRVDADVTLTRLGPDRSDA